MQPSSVSSRKTPCQILRSNSVYYIFHKLASKLSNETSCQNLLALACDMRSFNSAVNTTELEQQTLSHYIRVMSTSFSRFCLFLLLKAKLSDDVTSFSYRCWLSNVHVITVTWMRLFELHCVLLGAESWE
uniref:Uncharacterized protein n=1 Tax=Ixodes ricinus TaxID=34613 RepID=A0A147BBQ7_IXORI